MKKYKPVKIFCPQCKGCVGTYDGRPTSNYIARCGKCRKRVIYRIDNREIELKEIPKRNTSSGMTFI